MNTRQPDLPPAYVVHRVLLIAVVLVALAALGFVVAGQVVPLARWIMLTTHAAHEAWSWKWHL